jgi:putative endonuclease
VMVEVRTRRETFYGGGAETVFWQKQQKLLRAAQFYQQKEGWWGDIRFDVVSITLPESGEPVIEHIPDAFGE